MTTHQSWDVRDDWRFSSDVVDVTAHTLPGRKAAFVVGRVADSLGRPRRRLRRRQDAQDDQPASSRRDASGLRRRGAHRHQRGLHLHAARPPRRDCSPTTTRRSTSRFWSTFSSTSTTPRRRSARSHGSSDRTAGCWRSSLSKASRSVGLPCSGPSSARTSTSARRATSTRSRTMTSRGCSRSGSWSTSVATSTISSGSSWMPSLWAVQTIGPLRRGFWAHSPYHGESSETRPPIVDRPSGRRGLRGRQRSRMGRIPSAAERARDVGRGAPFSAQSGPPALPRQRQVADRRRGCGSGAVALRLRRCRPPNTPRGISRP